MVPVFVSGYVGKTLIMVVMVTWLQFCSVIGYSLSLPALIGTVSKVIISFPALTAWGLHTISFAYMLIASVRVRSCALLYFRKCINIAPLWWIGVWGKGKYICWISKSSWFYPSCRQAWHSPFSTKKSVFTGCRKERNKSGARDVVRIEKV